jgi:2-polyprenyl-3-methyl-5-hydroxy-6-metoxy-1,4-benzoquinol methylase
MLIMAACPVCENDAFAPTEQTVDVAEVLLRWEKAVDIRFPRAVHQSYRSSTSGPAVLHRCAVCGFGRFEPANEGTRAFYDAIEEVSNYYVDGKWEFEQAIRDLRNFRARSVLDVGCGSGHFLRLLRKSEPRMQLAGQDLSSKQLKRVRAEGFETVLGMPRPSLRAARDIEPFDAICVLQTLEHVAEPLAFLRSVLRLLRPGGVMIISTPNAAGPIRHFPDAITEVPPHHLTQWTEAAFRAALPRLGLRLEITRYEPLPDYLWDSYLPAQWGEGIWPALLFDPIALAEGYETVASRAGLAVQRLRALGIKRLHGVTSHTIYVLARLEQANEETD